MVTGTVNTFTCQRFHLEIYNGKIKRGKRDFSVLLEATGDDGNVYKLAINQTNVNTGLILKALGTIERFWPAYDFSFSGDTSTKRIVDFGT